MIGLSRIVETSLSGRPGSAWRIVPTQAVASEATVDPVGVGPVRMASLAVSRESWPSAGPGTVTAIMDVSTDGGQSWHEKCRATYAGGAVVDDGGAVMAESDCRWTPGTPFVGLVRWRIVPTVPVQTSARLHVVTSWP